jgi:hypothetical protein
MGDRRDRRRRWWTESTGVEQLVDRTQLPGMGDAAPPNEHLWIVLSAHRINPAAALAGEQIHLDNENLMDISPPCCFRCSALCTPEVTGTRCPGWKRI